MCSRSPGIPTTRLTSIRMLAVVMENHNVAAFDVAIGKQHPAKAVRGSVNLLVNEQKIADQQGMLHALGRNEVRLKNKGQQEKRRHHRLQQRGKRFRDAWADGRADGGTSPVIAQRLLFNPNGGGGRLLCRGQAHSAAACSSVMHAQQISCSSLDPPFSAAVSRSSARRAASCSASFLVLPLPAANGWPGSPSSVFSLSFHHEPFSMSGAALALHSVHRGAHVRGLRVFLQRRLVVAERGAGAQFLSQLLRRLTHYVPAHKRTHRIEPAIQKQRAQHCFHGIGKNRAFVPQAATVFSAAEPQVAAQPDGQSHFRNVSGG